MKRQSMTRKILAITLLLSCTTLSAWAGWEEEPIEKLIARADAHSDNQAEYCADVARREVEVANQYYTSGDVPKAEDAVKMAIAYSQKALDAGKRTHKKLKETDLTLRKTSRRLADVGQTLAYEDKPVVKDAVEKIEQIRSELLKLMFAQK
jgi:hypothetical protein